MKNILNNLIMEYSCGILIYRLNQNKQVEILLCSPSGPYWVNRKYFGIPKGHLEIGENDIDCAVRETYEETSIDFSTPKEELIDLGIIKQNKSKKVHVFGFYDKEHLIDTKNLVCLTKTTIEFPPKSNNFVTIDEVDSYTWFTVEELLHNNIPHNKSYDELYNNLKSMKIDG